MKQYIIFLLLFVFNFWLFQKINYLLDTKSNLGFEMDILFSYQKGVALYSKYRIGSIAGAYDPIEPFLSEKLYLIKTPFMLHYSISEDSKFTPTIMAGVQPFFLLKKISTIGSKIDEFGNHRPNEYAVANYSFILGIGTLKKVLKKINLLSQLRLEYVSDIRAIYNMQGYPIGLGDFFAGLMIGIVFNNKPSDKIFG